MVASIRNSALSQNKRAFHLQNFPIEQMDLPHQTKGEDHIYEAEVQTHQQRMMRRHLNMIIHATWRICRK